MDETVDHRIGPVYSSSATDAPTIQQPHHTPTAHHSSATHKSVQGRTFLTKRHDRSDTWPALPHTRGAARAARLTIAHYQTMNAHMK